MARQNLQPATSAGIQPHHRRRDGRAHQPTPQTGTTRRPRSTPQPRRFPPRQRRNDYHDPPGPTRDALEDAHRLFIRPGQPDWGGHLYKGNTMTSSGPAISPALRTRTTTSSGSPRPASTTLCASKPTSRTPSAMETTPWPSSSAKPKPTAAKAPNRANNYCANASALADAARLPPRRADHAVDSDGRARLPPPLASPALGASVLGREYIRVVVGRHRRNRAARSVG